MALTPAPTLLLAQTLRRRELLRPVGVARDADGNPSPGLLLSWDQVHRDGVDGDHAAAAPLHPLVADPGSTKGFGRPTVDRRAAAPWINRPAPTSEADWDRLCDDALAAQRSMHTDAFIIPSALLVQSDYPDGLQSALDASRRAWARRMDTDPPMFVRLAVSDTWLTTPNMRRTLLNQFTDLPEELGLALHVQWASGARGGSLADADSLDGLREVVGSVTNDNRRVLLIAAGLLGWISIAWGTWGFTAGLAQASWHTSTQVIRRRAGQPAPRVEWYFEPQLLTHVRRNTHQRIRADASYRGCACTFCNSLNPGGTNSWSHNLADQHALYSLARLTDQVAAPTLDGRRARVRRAIDDAVNAAPAFNLRGDDRPTHLADWIQRV